MDHLATTASILFTALGVALGYVIWGVETSVSDTEDDEDEEE